MKTEIYLLRHGEPELQQAMLGSTDAALSAKGLQQMQRASQNLSNFDLVVSSSLSRCADFAKSLGTARQWPVEMSVAFRECHFGQWDGKTYQQIMAEDPDNFSDFIEDPIANTPPGGESFQAFSARVMQGFNQLLATHSGKKILLLTHAGVIRQLVAWCLQMDQDSDVQFRHFAVDYASLSLISIYQDDADHELLPCLQFLNQRVEA